MQVLKWEDAHDLGFLWNNWDSLSLVKHSYKHKAGVVLQLLMVWGQLFWNEYRSEPTAPNTSFLPHKDKPLAFSKHQNRLSLTHQNQHALLEVVSSS